MVLDEMVYDPGTQEGSVSLSVIQGVFTFVSGEIAKTDPDAMTLDTPVATIGIRGTQLAMSFDPDDAGGDGLNVVLMEEADGFVGEVVVQNGGGVQILNVADMGTSVASANAAPSTPVQFDRGDIVNAFGGALKSLPDSVSGSTYGAEEAAAEDTVEEETAEETAGEEELAEEESGEEGADEEELAEELEEELAEEEEITEEELAESLDEEFETAAGGDDADLGDDGEFSVTDTAAAEEAAAAQAAADAAAEAAAAQAAAEVAAAATEAAAQAAADAAAQAAADASATAAAQAAAAAAQAAAEAAAVEALRQATANEPELTVGPASGDEDQEGGIPLDISVTSTDPVGNETLSVTISDLPDGATLSAGNDNGDGTWTLTEADLSGLTLITAENYNGDVALSVTATSTVSDREDGNSASTSDTIEVSVAAVNDAAIIGGTDSDTLTEGDVGDEPLTASGELTITDVDVGESVFQAQTDTVGSYGNFSVGTGGEWTYDLDPTAADWLTDGLVVTETFEVLSADGTSTTVTVTITGTDDAPVIGGTASDTLTETDAAQQATGQLTITDADAGESVFQAQTDTAGSYGNFSVGTGGDWTFDLDPTTADALTDGQEVTETFDVLSADGTSTTVTVTITGTNDAPVIGGTSSDSLTETDAAQQASGQLTITDADAGESVFQAQTDTVGSYGNFSVGTGGDWTYDLDPTTADALTDGQEVTETFEVLSADGTSTTVTVTITGTNDAPELVGSGAADQLADADTAFSYDASANFTDVDAGDVMTFSATLENGDPLPSWVSIDTATGELSGTPDSGDAGILNVTVTATDLLGASSSDTFAIEVTDSDVNVINVSGTFDDDVSVEGTSGDDAITVDGTFGDDLRVTGGDGDDTITVGGTVADDLSVKGGSGDDTITVTGDVGDDVHIHGGSGDDIITMSGTYDEATIEGGSGADELYGGVGDDTLEGGAGDDILSGGAGDDVIDGGAGNDEALYADDYNEFSVVIEEDGSVSITHNDGDEGTDTLSNVESIQFADGSVTVADIGDADGGFNYAPVISGDGELEVDSGGSATITGDDLTVGDTEDGAEEITFTLLDDPDFGSLMLGGAELSEGDTFTQGDIDGGLLSYNQDEDAGVVGSDSFRFTAKDSEDEEIRNDEDAGGGYQVSDDGAATINITIDASAM